MNQHTPTAMTLTKVEARHAIEKIPEIRSGIVNMRDSSIGFCNESKSDNNGKVWALLSLQNGDMVQYSGYADEPMRKQRLSLGGDDHESKRDKLLKLRSAEGFQDINSKALPTRPWADADADGDASSYRGKKKRRTRKCASSEYDEESSEDEDCTYRGKRRRTKCSKKKAKSCKRSSKCSWRKGKYVDGKRVRKGSCAKRSRRTRRTRRTRRSRRTRKSRCSMKDKQTECEAEGCTWVAGKRGRSSYCRKSSKRRSKRSHKSSKKAMCSNKKKRSCKRSSKCSYRKSKYIDGKRVRKGSCAKKSRKSRKSRKSKHASACNAKRKKRSCKRSSKCKWTKKTPKRKGFCSKK